MVSEGFQRGLKPCGSEGFQRGLKPCGFRGVSEGSETVGGECPKCVYDSF